MTKTKSALLSLAAIALALAAVLVTPSGRAFAAVSSEEFWNLNDSWNITWGTKKVGVYANSVSSYLRVFINNADTLAVTATGVGIGTNSPTNALTVSGAANITGALTVAGTLTQPGNNVEAAAGTSTLLTPGTAATFSQVLGLFATPSIALGGASQNNGVNISTIVPVNTSFETVISSGGALTLTSLPSISTTTLVGGITLIPDGTYLVLTATTTTNTVTLQSNGALAGSQLFLGASTRTIALHKRILLQFYQNVPNAAYWEEVSYIDDNH